MVEDINNCAPTFGQDVLHFKNVPETAAIGEIVATGECCIDNELAWNALLKFLSRAI